MSKTKRERIIPEPVFKTEDQAKEALKEECEIQIALNKLDSELNEKTHAIKEEYEKKMAPLKARKARLEKDLCEFYTANRDTIFPKNLKSVIYTFGTVSFRLSTPSVKQLSGHSVAKSLELITAFDPDNKAGLITVKTSLNKETLVKYSPEELKEFGLRKDQEETFGIQLNLESIQATA